MARTKDKPPLPTVIKRAGRLTPETAWDAEALDALPEGAALETRERSPRSLPHHKLYWAALKTAVEATGRCPRLPRRNIGCAHGASCASSAWILAC